jgi:hypothetical protein
MGTMTATTDGWPERPRLLGAQLPGAVPVSAPAHPSAQRLSGADGHVLELKKVLSYVAAARDRAESARRTLAREGAARPLLSALAETEESLRQEQVRLLRALNAEVA